MTKAGVDAIVETLRGRLLRGLQAGALEAGSRLPSARELVGEFGGDHRVILAAYQQLADEGLVEVRERGGVYVSANSAAAVSLSALPAAWFVDALTEGLAHAVRGPELHEWLRRATDTLRLRAFVISTTEDQVAGLVRELIEDFGMLADGLPAPDFANLWTTPMTMPTALQRADVVIATVAHRELVDRLGAELGKPVIVIEVRPDLAVGEWALLLRQPVWAVVATRAFGHMLQQFFKNVKGAENLNVLVHGEDDLTQIPAGAPTYVTQRVRQAIGAEPLPGRVLPPARTIASASARVIFEFIVTANMSALRAVRPVVQRQSPQLPPPITRE